MGKVIMLATAITLLSGCVHQPQKTTYWVNPHIDDSYASQMQFEIDRSYCDAVAQGSVASPQSRQAFTPQGGTFNTFNYQTGAHSTTTYQPSNGGGIAGGLNRGMEDIAARDRIRSQRRAIFNACMMERNWTTNIEHAKHIRNQLRNQ